MRRSVLWVCTVMMVMALSQGCRDPDSSRKVSSGRAEAGPGPVPEQSPEPFPVAGKKGDKARVGAAPRPERAVRIEKRYCYEGFCDYRVKIVSPDGSIEKTMETEMCRPELSPDGRWLAYDGDSGVRVYDVLEGKDFEVAGFHYDTAVIYDRGEACWIWSTDSRKVAFITHNQNRYPQQGKLIVYDVKTRELARRKVAAFMMCGSVCYTTAPFWSHDSRYVIVLEADYHVFAKPGFNVICASTGKPVKRIPVKIKKGEDGGYADVAGYGWSDDGKSLYLLAIMSEPDEKKVRLEVPFNVPDDTCSQ